MIQLDDRHFMMIEPGQRTVEPVMDELTEMAARVMKSARVGNHYLGYHTCRCGEQSDSATRIMPDGRVSNSLVVHYVMFHRADIPRSEIAKLLCYAKDIV